MFSEAIIAAPPVLAAGWSFLYLLFGGRHRWRILGATMSCCRKRTFSPTSSARERRAREQLVSQPRLARSQTGSRCWAAAATAKILLQVCS
jgi:hypothetical protein